jgi:hypothetical protein
VPLSFRGRDIAIAAVLTAVFVAFQIQASLNAGTLSFPATYDDIMYYIDAARRVRTFWQGSIGDVLREYIANPPHAPGSTLLAAIGFLLFDIKPWAADAANALPLFVFVLILLRLYSDLPLGVALPAVIASLCIPIFGLAIVEFRPDMWCAGLAVVGTLLIALRDPRDFRTAVAAGIAFAAALLMKPTLSPLVVILFGAALTLRLAPHLADRTALLSATFACLIVAGLAILIAGPHYVLGLKNLVWYYREVIFGPGAAVWTPQISRTDKALYYLTGPGSLPSLGRWVYISPLTLAVPIVLSIRRHALAWQAWIVVILALIAYAVVTLPGNKSPYLGVIFPGYVAGAIVVSAAYGLRSLYFRKMTGAAHIAAILLLCFAAYAYRTPWLLLNGTVLPPYIAASRLQVIDEAAQFFKLDPDLARKTVMLAQIGQYTNGESLIFKLLQDGGPTPTFVSEFLTDDLRRHVVLLNRADYVIALTRDNPDAIPWLPSAKIADQLNAMLPEKFELAKTIVPPEQPGEVRIYRKRP